jgi:hypothetical protein
VPAIEMTVALLAATLISADAATGRGVWGSVACRLVAVAAALQG